MDESYHVLHTTASGSDVLNAGAIVVKVRDMLTAKEIAQRLGLSRSRVYQLAREGRIPVVRQGRSMRVPLVAWERWLAAQGEAALASLRSDT